MTLTVVRGHWFRVPGSDLEDKHSVCVSITHRRRPRVTSLPSLTLKLTDGRSRWYLAPWIYNNRGEFSGLHNLCV